MTLLTKPDEREYEIVEFEDDEREEAPISDQDRTLKTIFSSLEDNTADVLVKVYRVNEMGREAHCFDCGPDDMEGIEDRLREAYGKGDYRLKAYAPTGDGSRKSIKRVVKLALETPIQPEQPKDNSNDIRQLIAEMQRNQTEQQMNMMHMFKEQQLESQNRMTENQMRMQELLIQAMGNRPEQASLTEQLAVLKQLQPEQKDPMEMMEFMFTMNSKFQEMAQPGESTPLGELSNGINSLVKLAAQSPAKQGGSTVINAQANTPPQAENQPQPEQPLQPPQTMNEINLDNPFVQATLRQQLQGLITKAQQNKNWEIYADLILEELPDRFYPLLVEAIGDNNEQALATFAKIEPGIMRYPDWFGGFADYVRDIFAAVREHNDLIDEDYSGDNSDSLDSNQQSDVSPATTTAFENDAAHESHPEGDTGR